jgi:multicomponent Na+:H+ antiporter subunit F
MNWPFMNCLPQNCPQWGILPWALLLTAVMLTAAVLLTFIRLLRGPSVPDRVVALDLLTVLVVAVVAIYNVATEQSVLFDAAIVLALLAFLGTVAFAQYLERSGRDD